MEGLNNVPFSSETERSSWTSAIFATGKNQAMTKVEPALKVPNMFHGNVTFALSYSFCPERQGMDEAIITPLQPALAHLNIHDAHSL